jgi:hypothetical protein
VATRRVKQPEPTETVTIRTRPATTPEAREQQLVAAAFDLVETRIRKGTATSQEVTHFLKLGSSREFLEQERIRGEVEVNKAKIENMKQANRIEELMQDALNAMRSYKGETPNADQESQGR